MAANTTALGLISYVSSSIGAGLLVLHISFIILLSLMGIWFKDVIVEGTYEGTHEIHVQIGLRLGVVLFIISEIMFFFAFFWAFFHSSLSPAVSIGCVWPPLGIETLNPWEVPFLNTLILLSSGVSVTYAHRALLVGARKRVIVALAITILLGVIFTLCQIYEYINAPFSINDSVYGSIFHMATGFHGFHAVIGTSFLAVCFIRHLLYHFTQYHHLGFEAAAWYWHSVDVAWLFLFTSIYWRGP